MSFSLNAIPSAQVTISGGVNNLPPTFTNWDNTRVQGSAITSGNTATDVYQAAAGKSIIGYVTIVQDLVNAGNQGCLVTKTDSANAVIETLYDSRSANNWLLGDPVAVQVPIPVCLNSQEKVRVTGAASGLQAVNFQGYESS